MTKVKFKDQVKESFVASNTSNDFVSHRKKDEQKERYDIYMSTVGTDESDSLDVFVIEIPTKMHGRDDVKEAKEKEIKNLEHYAVFDKINDHGQERIGARWVVTEKEGHDGQKVKVKARLVARGFQV